MYNNLTKKQKDEYVIEATDNQFVKSLDMKNMKLIYSNDFYLCMYKKIESGMSYIKAYESLGFDTNKLGKDRAYSAGKRAKQLGQSNSFTIDPSNYDGSVSKEEFGNLSLEEELAYLKARNLYLETVIEVQKKTPLILEELIMSLKKK